jgi:hypothetical protein
VLLEQRQGGEAFASAFDSLLRQGYNRGMDRQFPSRAPLIIVIALMLLPVLYVGSYYAMVGPWAGSGVFAGELYAIHYRCPLVHPYAVRVFFRPLQMIDLRLRPVFWTKPTDPNLPEEP